MGSPFGIILVTDDAAKAERLADSSFALVDSLCRIFSDYDSGSELSRLNRSAGSKVAVRVSDPLFEVLLMAGQAAAASGGAFDITVGPLSQVWRRAVKQSSFPSPYLVNIAKAHVGFRQLVIDSLQRTAQLAKQRMLLDAGGIAKGYIAQQVVNFLARNGIRQSLADAGGDIVAGDAPPGSKGWTIGVNVPETTDSLLRDQLLLSNKAVATSGDVYRFIRHNGKKYAHIIDPRTGYGITSQRNVTVIAANGAEADWLATACSVLPVDEARQLAESRGAEVMINEVRNGKMLSFRTKGFNQYGKPRG